MKREFSNYKYEKIKNKNRSQEIIKSFNSEVLLSLVKIYNEEEHEVFCFITRDLINDLIITLATVVSISDEMEDILSKVDSIFLYLKISITRDLMRSKHVTNKPVVDEEICNENVTIH